MTQLELDIARARRALCVYLAALSWTVLLLALLGMLMLVAPHLEAEHFPVGKNFRAVQVPSEMPHYLALRITGEKVRSCEFVEAVALVDVDGVGPLLPEKAEVWMGGRGVGLSRPRGVQDFGVWHFNPIGRSVQLVARHRCHPLWLTETRMLEWSAPQ